MGSFRLARLYEVAGMKEFAIRAASCSTWLEYGVTDGGEKQLQAANFCQLRLCPLCIARRAKKAAYQLCQVLNYTQMRHDSAQYVFLTLTVRNCSGDQLGETLGRLTKAWEHLRKNRAFERAVKGTYRAIEITRHGDEYHPHIHAILAVEPEYFKRKSGLYITHDEWVERWQKALRADYAPTVHIQRTHAKGGKGAGMATSLEAAKYATKSSDYIDNRLGDEEGAHIVRTYTEALYNRRLVGYSGWLKESARALKIKEEENMDLVHIEEEGLREDVAEMIEVYRWSFGVGDYVLTERRINPLRVVRQPAPDKEGA